MANIGGFKSQEGTSVLPVLVGSAAQYSHPQYGGQIISHVAITTPSTTADQVSSSAAQQTCQFSGPSTSHGQNEIKESQLLNLNPAAALNGNNTTDSATLEHDEEPVVDIVISNVVSTFATRCHLNLRRIATEGLHVIFKREHGMVSMKLRNPYTTASIWSSGKVTVTGATSEEAAKVACRKVARCIQKLGYRVKFSQFRVVNVLGTCSFPWGIRITQFSQDNPRNASYEPELHPGVTYRITDPKATMKIFSTGSVTITAPRVENVQAAVEHLYPIAVNYKMAKAEVSKNDDSHSRLYQSAAKRRKVEAYRRRNIVVEAKPDSEEEQYTSCSEDFDSDESQD